MPTHEKVLKRLRRKRRRIRRYFDGAENIGDIAVTLSRTDNLPGIKLSAQAKHGGQKGMTASESYIHEPACANNPDAAYCHVLALLLQLMLDDNLISIFYDQQTLKLPQEAGFYSELKKEFGKLEFSAVDKGFHLDRMRQKLADLKHRPNNEIVKSFITELL